jgi:antitoxin (DNA-binding transcriptional repressor) of toxin-antitoxin stability system
MSQSEQESGRPVFNLVPQAEKVQDSADDNSSKSVENQPIVTTSLSELLGRVKSTNQSK